MTEIEIIRVDGKAICPKCGSEYRHHPEDLINVSNISGEVYLLIGCDGKRLKL